jgi:uridine kinase
MKEESKQRKSRFILSVCGPSGAGKSQLAKALVGLLGEATCARVPTDYYLLPTTGPLEVYLRQPVYYDWPLLDRDLSVPDGIVLTTPDFDFESFVRRAERGGRTFKASPVMVLDGMYPYPGADAAILLQVPSPIRKARIQARDQGWGTDVAARWEQLEQSRIYLEELSATYDLVLEGTDDLSTNAATVAAFIASRQKCSSGLSKKGAGDIA